tara:strand:+ start:223 stop:351 length:129 start_codon:yes stop_codon:yes gene_type:complete
MKFSEHKKEVTSSMEIKFSLSSEISSEKSKIVDINKCRLLKE